MENAKNTFYVTLRDRLAVVNPERTMVLRGLIRPGILVEENEMLTAMQPPDVFVLRWTKLQVDTNLPIPLAQMECEFLYATDGNADNAGMDRGRLLAAMDAELMAMMTPNSTQKMNYTPNTVQTMQTNVFWGNPVFAPVKVTDERLERSATVQVYSYEEPGEL
ncbi:MAG: hypothetical protein ACYC46_07790 [Acidobacteriaceae bacterium]